MLSKLCVKSNTTLVVASENIPHCFEICSAAIKRTDYNYTMKKVLGH